MIGKASTFYIARLFVGVALKKVVHNRIAAEYIKSAGKKEAFTSFYFSDWYPLFHSIIFLGTDGIWETRDVEGSLFGKQAVLDIICNNSGSGAGEMLDKILTALNDFRQVREGPV